MNVLEMIDRAKDTASVGRVFGDPVTQDGVTVIPVARISGGGGGGEGKQEGEQPSEGTGGGFGLGVTPEGMFVIKDAKVRWLPVVNVNRVILGGQIVAVVVLLTVRAIARLRARK
ncbi:spore germination protein GerW family protein [Sphaerisporangium dianthi]|uniref:Spore germination protein GerW family protein n=1 Tax=Sphaerisporangium dianthi TaxID=1436120 RepID=A0ABV9C9V0_9ACTN